MVLGAFGFPGVIGQQSSVVQWIPVMMNYLKAIPDIVGSVWWVYDYVFNPVCDTTGTGCQHKLADPNTGALTPEGVAYDNNM
jgi:hypothetical protein